MHNKVSYVKLIWLTRWSENIYDLVIRKYLWALVCNLSVCLINQSTQHSTKSICSGILLGISVLCSSSLFTAVCPKMKHLILNWLSAEKLRLRKKHLEPSYFMTTSRSCRTKFHWRKWWNEVLALKNKRKLSFVKLSIQEK